MTACHAQLSTLGVVTDVLDDMVDCATKSGALGAKLTGAGGGGAVIALAPGREEEVIESWKQAGYEAFVSTVGVCL